MALGAQVLGEGAELLLDGGCGGTRLGTATAGSVRGAVANGAGRDDEDGGAMASGAKRLPFYRAREG